MLKFLIPPFLVFCANCFGQSLTCATNGGVNTPVRAEGLAEIVGDFQVTCTGGTPTPLGSPVPTVDIKILVNTQITSRLLAANWSEAMLLMDEPAPAAQRMCGTAGDTEPSPGVCTITGTGTGAGVYSGAAGRPNIFQGLRFATNGVIFTGVPIDPPGISGQRILRITNIRANANALGVASGNNAPTSITETIVTEPNPSSVLPVSGLVTQAVGSVQTGMAVSVTGNPVFQYDVPQNAALALDANSNGVSQFSVRFRELFSTAFKKRNIATNAADPAALSAQNDLTVGSFNTESNFYNNAFPNISGRGNLGLAGLGDGGTRLMVHFSAIPVGVKVFAKASGNIVGGGPGAVQMVSTDVNGAGPYLAVTGNASGIAPLPVVNGSATAVYEVIESDPNSFAILDIPIYIAYSPNSGAATTAVVNLSFAPVSVFTDASAIDPAPRFADTSTGMNAFTILPLNCSAFATPSASFGAEGGPATVSVIAHPACHWTAYGLGVTVVSGGPTSGNGEVTYTVPPNNSFGPVGGFILLTSGPNPGPVQAAFPVYQTRMECSYTVSPGAKGFPSAGGTGSITVHAVSTVVANSSMCAWSTFTNDAWITVTSGSSGGGDGTVEYSVAADAGPSRIGMLEILDYTLTSAADPVMTITQQGPNVPTPGSVNSASGAGTTHSFVFTFSDPNGWQDLGVVNVLINRALDGNNACYLAYDRPSNVLYLVDDGGAGLTGLTLSGAGSVSNSQCTVNGAGSSSSGTGNTLTLMLSISFNQSNFAGEKITYLAARDAAQNNSGWRMMGVWSVPRLSPVFPSIMSVTPSEGGGSTQTFTVTYRDIASSANLRTMQLLVNSALDGTFACYLGYDHASNQLYLVNDDNSALLLPGIAPNSGVGNVQNSQCGINGAGTTKSESGTDLTLNISLTFKSSFSGPKVAFTGVQTISNANSDWHALGFWNVP